MPLLSLISISKNNPPQSCRRQSHPPPPPPPSLTSRRCPLETSLPPPNYPLVDVMPQSINACRAAYAKRRANNAAAAALAARGPPMSPDHPPETKGDDDLLITPTVKRTAALLNPPMPSISITTAPSALSLLLGNYSSLRGRFNNNVEFRVSSCPYCKPNIILILSQLQPSTYSLIS